MSKDNSRKNLKTSDGSSQQNSAGKISKSAKKNMLAQGQML